MSSSRAFVCDDGRGLRAPGWRALRAAGQHIQRAAGLLQLAALPRTAAFVVAAVTAC